MKNKKLIYGISAIIILVVVLTSLFWFSLDKTTRCNFVHGKNICNFYAMMDIANNNPSISDFDKMMNLCRDMENVPKKDKCFEYVALTFAQIDMSKAKEACDEIKGFRDEVGHVVYTKEGCYDEIMQKSKKRNLRNY